MRDGIVPALEFGDAATNRAVEVTGCAPANGLVGVSGPPGAPRTLDLRRTEAPALGDMPARQRKNRQRRRYAVALLDSAGRLTDQQLFSQLGWSPGTRVRIGRGDGYQIVVRSDEHGDSSLTSRNMVLVPASLRHWCGYDAGDPVLVVAVPTMSAVVLHPIETLDQALPDPAQIVERMRPAGVSLAYASPTVAVGEDDDRDGECAAGLGAPDGDGTAYVSRLDGDDE
ncbi:hypothetical protein ACIRG5_19280 [Lentzea sp. NPDC102401]|uniref:hypothetical protein n=1 Tax=Lentzea sp. NPDC102401 TaxID=3364128 RepID=UPI0038240600